MTDVCNWTAQGTITQSTFKTKDGGGGYWQVFIRVDKGDLCLYFHNEAMQSIIERLSLGTKIRVSGVITPHNQVNRADRPYFLSPSTLEVVNVDS